MKADKIETPSDKAISDMAKEATHPGSIYTHDIHIEPLMQEIVKLLSGSGDQLQPTFANPMVLDAARAAEADADIVAAAASSLTAGTPVEQLDQETEVLSVLESILDVLTVGLTLNQPDLTMLRGQNALQGKATMINEGLFEKTVIGDALYEAANVTDKERELAAGLGPVMSASIMEGFKNAPAAKNNIVERLAVNAPISENAQRGSTDFQNVVYTSTTAIQNAATMANSSISNASTAAAANIANVSNASNTSIANATTAAAANIASISNASNTSMTNAVSSASSALTNGTTLAQASLTDVTNSAASSLANATTLATNNLSGFAATASTTLANTTTEANQSIASTTETANNSITSTVETTMNQISSVMELMSSIVSKGFGLITNTAGKAFNFVSDTFSSVFGGSDTTSINDLVEGNGPLIAASIHKATETSIGGTMVNEIQTALTNLGDAATISQTTGASIGDAIATSMGDTFGGNSVADSVTSSLASALTVANQADQRAFVTSQQLGLFDFDQTKEALVSADEVAYKTLSLGLEQQPLAPEMARAEAIEDVIPNVVRSTTDNVASSLFTAFDNHYQTSRSMSTMLSEGLFDFGQPREALSTADDVATGMMALTIETPQVEKVAGGQGGNAVVTAVGGRGGDATSQAVSGRGGNAYAFGARAFGGTGYGYGAGGNARAVGGSGYGYGDGTGGDAYAFGQTIDQILGTTERTDRFFDTNATSDLITALNENSTQKSIATMQQMGLFDAGQPREALVAADDVTTRTLETTLDRMVSQQALAATTNSMNAVESSTGATEALSSVEKLLVASNQANASSVNNRFTSLVEQGLFDREQISEATYSADTLRDLQTSMNAQIMSQIGSTVTDELRSAYTAKDVSDSKAFATMQQMGLFDAGQPREAMSTAGDVTNQMLNLGLAPAMGTDGASTMERLGEFIDRRQKDVVDRSQVSVENTGLFSKENVGESQSESIANMTKYYGRDLNNVITSIRSNNSRKAGSASSSTSHYIDNEDTDNTLASALMAANSLTAAPPKGSVNTNLISMEEAEAYVARHSESGKPNGPTALLPGVEGILDMMADAAEREEKMLKFMELMVKALTAQRGVRWWIPIPTRRRARPAALGIGRGTS